MRALSRIFRGKFHQALRNEGIYSLIPPKVWTEDWVVHCEPVGSGVGALKYLAPYIFRVAISNNRILKLEQDRVTFRYRDTATGKERCCTLSAQEFIRRFLQHVLPKGFVKVRYYGLFSPGLRKSLKTLRRSIALSQKLDDLVVTSIQQEETHTKKDKSKAPLSIPCPICGCAMQPDLMIIFSGHDPP